MTAERITPLPVDDGAGIPGSTAGSCPPIVIPGFPDPPLVERPEHDWPGEVFVAASLVAMFGCVVAAAAAALGTVVFLLMGEFANAGLAALAAAGLAVGWTVQGALAWHVGRFSRQGWWGAMAETAVIALAWLYVASTDPVLRQSALIAIVLDLLWMRYFWNRRHDFDTAFGF